MSTILVTGSTGFIGSHLTQKLLKEGYDVYALVRHVTKRQLEIFGDDVKQIRFVEGDLSDFHSLELLVESCAPQAIVHLGALTPVRLSYDDPFSFIRTNITGTCNLTHAILQRAPRARFIVASSAEVYGWQPREPTKETARLRPSSPYGVSKAAADQYVQMAMAGYGLQATILRCNNTYGRKGENNFFVEYVVSSMMRKTTVYVGTPDHTRDYMFVDDHVNAYSLAIENEKSVGYVLNVSPGNPTTNISLAKKVAEKIGFGGEIVSGSYPPGYPRRPTTVDTDYIVLDSSLVREILGWRPTVTLDEGLLKTIEMWRGI